MRSAEGYRRAKETLDSAPERNYKQGMILLFKIVLASATGLVIAWAL
jgi:hypothetical protein